MSPLGHTVQSQAGHLANSLMLNCWGLSLITELWRRQRFYSIVSLSSVVTLGPRFEFWICQEIKDFNLFWGLSRGFRWFATRNDLACATSLLLLQRNFGDICLSFNYLWNHIEIRRWSLSATFYAWPGSHQKWPTLQWSFTILYYWKVNQSSGIWNTCVLN